MDSARGDSRKAAQGMRPLDEAERRELSGAVIHQRSRRQSRRAHGYTPAGGYKSAPFLADALKGFQLNLAYEVPELTRIGLPVQLPS